MAPGGVRLPQDPQAASRLLRPYAFKFHFTQIKFWGLGSNGYNVPPGAGAIGWRATDIASCLKTFHVSGGGHTKKSATDLNGDGGVAGAPSVAPSYRTLALNPEYGET